MSNTNKLLENPFSYLNINSRSANLALLLLRFYAGFTIMLAGLDKIPLPDWMTEQVASLGFPAASLFAWCACFGEFAFGALLCLGLMTRLSSIILAFIMGVAGFAFHQVLPLVDMHIAQHFFWIFVLFAVIGGGNYALDYWVNRHLNDTKLGRYAVITLSLGALLSINAYIAYTTPPPSTTENNAIQSVNIPGTFNDWNPAANEMDKIDSTTYRLDMAFERAGAIAFKFTTNKSWDTNLGAVEQSSKGFPITGTAVLDKGNNTQNIEAYIPAKGTYRFTINAQTYTYRLDSLTSTPK